MNSWIQPPTKPKPRKIAVEGNIGAGKTTLATAVAQFLGYEMMVEPVADNELLEAFYQDKKKYGFVFQVHMLTVRCAQERAGTWMIASNQAQGVLYDRTLAGDTCFAEVNTAIGNISPAEYRVYLNLYELMKYSSPYPDLLLFLDIPVEKLLARIVKRGREFERYITEDYLYRIDRAYQRFLDAMMHRTTVVMVREEDIPFLDPDLEDGWEPGDAFPTDLRAKMGEFWDKVLWTYNRRDPTRFEKTLLQH